MGTITITLDRCLSKAVYDGCKKNGQKIWWIKKGNKFVDIGRTNHANQPLNITIKAPEPGLYTIGCGPDAKDGGIREQITIPDQSPATPSVSAGSQAPPAQAAQPPAKAAAPQATAEVSANDQLSKAESEITKAVEYIMSGTTKAKTRQDLLAFLEKSVKTDIAYLNYMLCRIDEARVSEGDSIQDIVSCVVERSTHSLSSARQVLG